MPLILRPFDPQQDRDSVQHLLSALEDEGRLEIGIEDLVARMSGGGFVALQHDRCVAAATAELTEGAEEADLVWLVESGAASEAGAALLAAVRSHAIALGATSLLCYLSESDAENLAFFDSEGAESVSGYSRWTAELNEATEAEPMEGLTVQATDDPDVLLAATQAAWSDLPGHKPATPAAITEAIEAFGTSNHFAVLDETGQPVGLVRGLMISTDEAYVDAPGLAPRFRSAENYSLLAKLAMNHLAGLGAKTAIMDSWGDVPEAVGGWQSAGWTRQKCMPARRVALA